MTSSQSRFGAWRGAGQARIVHARIVHARIVHAQSYEDLTGEVEATRRAWRRSRMTSQKHVFVLSEAGKPVYSRFRSEEALSSTAGVMMALVSFLETEKNALRSIHADGYTAVFVRRSPLVLVSVSHAQQSEQEMAQELLYVYYQVVSLVTGAQLHHLFQQRPSYDLRRLLSGSERITDNLLAAHGHGPQLPPGRCALPPSAPALRDTATYCLQQAKARSLVFSILMSQQQLLTPGPEEGPLSAPHRHPPALQPGHLLQLLPGGRGLDTRVPPKVQPVRLLPHTHLLPEPRAGLLLLMVSTDREDFFTASDCKRKIVERLEKRGTWAALTEALTNSPYDAAQVGIPELRHFLYKSKSSGLFTSPAMAAPYNTEGEQKRLVSLYQHLHGRAHCSSRPLTTVYHMGPRESVLAWVTEAFELYVCFSPLGSKSSAVNGVSRLLRWIRKEEEKLFILSSPTY
ncbi:unnamed protein product [Ranitomeya imitator]|uniref:Vacuolar fusion protein MON1 homolog n=1 Tax=Ranitomeya imitator TaxID=111125 RepID=A0ABN9MBT0_9NEOB|nr:unnamed protein product [Ranitomeya imitator]